MMKKTATRRKPTFANTVCACLYICMFVCMFVSLFLCIFVCMFLCLYVLVCFFVCLFLCMLCFLFVYTYVFCNFACCLFVFSLYVFCLGVCNAAFYDIQRICMYIARRVVKQPDSLEYDIQNESLEWISLNECISSAGHDFITIQFHKNTFINRASDAMTYWHASIVQIREHGCLNPIFSIPLTYVNRYFVHGTYMCCV
jgi:hypothetical protein